MNEIYEEHDAMFKALENIQVTIEEGWDDCDRCGKNICLKDIDVDGVNKIINDIRKRKGYE